MHRVTLRPSGLQFDAEDHESVLTAALRQGYVLPYGCKNGACGSCKGKLLEGTLDYGVYQKKALPDEEKAQGKALFCQARPLSDVVIEARAIGAAKDIQIKTLPCRVQKLERLADDVMAIFVKLPANERLHFLAGQFIEFLLKGGARRSFSMANPPDAELLELHVRHVAGGQFTDHVFGKMKERDILRFEGPLGTFFLREDSDKPMLLVASGTGFAPIKSLIENALHKGVTRPMVLYWGGRRPKDLYQNELPVKWAAEHAQQFRYVPVISDGLPEDAWTGRTGFVHRAVMQDFPDLSAHQVYACGVPIMVDSARHDFTRQCGLPEDEFYADSFTTQADLAVTS